MIILSCNALIYILFKLNNIVVTLFIYLLIVVSKWEATKLSLTVSES